MQFIDYDALERTPLRHDPYQWFVVEQLIRPEVFKTVAGDFPSVRGPGSHALSSLRIGGRFAELISELDGPDFKAALERKFETDLSPYPTTFSVRGFCRKKDGAIHTDSKTKVITVLLYLNDEWDQRGGRLRILRNGEDINNYAAEINPIRGTTLFFRRSDKSWHGHEPCEGARRAVQMNWVTSEEVVNRAQFKHRISSILKRFRY